MNKCRLTNLDIYENYRDESFYFFHSDFTGAFAYWVIKQSPYNCPDIMPALKAFSDHVDKYVSYEKDIPRKLSYSDLEAIVSEKIFESIPEIRELNEPKIDTGQPFAFCSRYDKPKPDYDFIDLGA